MLDRRDFLKGFVAAGLVMSHGDLFSESLMNMPEKTSPKRNRAIYCVVDNSELEAALKTCAEEINCEILFDCPESPELFFDHHYLPFFDGSNEAVGDKYVAHFVAVVDGSIIDEAVWDMYVEFCNDGDIKAPCLLIGNSEHLEVPQIGDIYHLAANDHGAIVDTIKKIKSGLLTSV